MKKIIFFSIISLICARAQGQWQLTGNAGTNSGTNFIGTTDAKNFKIRTSNTIRMNITSTGKVGIGNFTPIFKLDVKSGSINTDSVYRIKGNTVLSVKGDYNLFTGVSSGFSNTLGGANVGSGYQALYSNTEGNFNTASGYNAMQFNTKGYNNTAIGAHALINNRTASENIAIGNAALFVQSYNNGGVDWVSANVAVGSFALFANQPTSTSEGVNNTAVGHSALRSNTTGDQNTAIGKDALYFNTTGTRNTANGREALYSNISGSYNTAGGFEALYSNTSGSNNTANGDYALSSNTIGTYNTAAGGFALYANTTASENTATGGYALYAQDYDNGGNAWTSANTAVGYDALHSNNPTSTTNGINNTAVGHSALRSNSSGLDNTSVGRKALYASNIGSENTAIGEEALANNTNGGRNTACGNNALYTNTTGNYNTSIGAYSNTSLSNLSNTTAIGDGATVNAVNKVRIGNINVTVFETQTGAWQPSDGRFKENVKEDVKGLDFIMKLQPVSYNFNRLKFAQHVKQHSNPDKDATMAEQSKIRTVGFIAQDVEKIIEQTGFTDFDAVHAPTNETDNYSMGYAAFVVPLVKAVQELNEELKSEVGSLKSEIENLKSEISNLKSGESAIQNPKSEILFQNSPNPFNTQTEIKFRLPLTFGSAQLIIIDAEGKQVRSVDLKSSSPVIIKAAELSAGTYTYSLVIDGINADSKQMILTK